MNSISWFLYLASAFENLNTVAGPALFFCFVALIAATGARVAVFCAARCDVKDCVDFQPTMKILFRLTLGVWCGVAVIYTLVPDKKTVYAIAASQVGERVAQSEAVQGLASDATKALQAWINKQLEKK